jgi:hypothetical protein
MKLFLSYLSGHKGALAVALLSCAVFALTFALYGLPLGAILYPTLLCALFWVLYILWRLLRLRRTHRLLLRLARQLPPHLEEELPPSGSPLEEDYQTLLLLLQQQQRTLRSTMNRRYEDMMNYYTLWAHQIKTPIASMRLTLQNEDSPLSRRLSADLLRIEQYVDMVLVFLRLDGDSTDYVLRPCDLDAIVRGAVKRFAGEFISRKLRLDYQPLSLTVLTDEKWLRFVVEQVLSNALKYTPTGGITITVEGDKILCIQDTGIGIAPEDLPRIFEQGYTGCNGRTDQQATGIGLSLCKRICANLGHRIWVESQVDVGTTVRIDLAQRKLEVE